MLLSFQICRSAFSFRSFCSLGTKTSRTCRRPFFSAFFFPGGETETNSNSKLSSVEVSPSSGLPVKNLGFLRCKLGDGEVHPHDMPYNQRLQKSGGSNHRFRMYPKPWSNKWDFNYLSLNWIFFSNNTS